MKLLVIALLVELCSCNLYEEKVDHFEMASVILKISSETYESQQEDFIEEDLVHVEDKYIYDFIVVGGGTAGSIVASRLAENKNWKILLIESGPPENNMTLIPAYNTLLETTSLTYNYTVTKNMNSCRGMIDGRCGLIGGRMLGGGSSINGMFWTRGDNLDYDDWEGLGNRGWNSKEVLKYFQRLERCNFLHQDPSRGIDGRIPLVNCQSIKTPLNSFFIPCLQMGLKIADYNGPEQETFTRTQINEEFGRRVGAASAYLSKKPKNLVLEHSSNVVELLFEGERAVGVKYAIKPASLLVKAKATKEVILSAGAIESPHLLILSGIGPKPVLDKLKIPPRAYLPVGENLKNHMAFNGFNIILNGRKPIEENSLLDMADYTLEGFGPLTNPGMEFVIYKKTLPNLDRPDIEIVGIGTIFNEGFNQLRSTRFSKELYDAVFKPTEGQVGFNLNIMITHPKSTGRIVVQDRDPYHLPLVDLNGLSEDEDVEAMLRGIKFAEALIQKDTLKNMNITLNKNPVPGCGDFGTDEYWRCAIRSLSTYLRHPTGTARMGPKQDKKSVVDAELKVHNIKGLRVIDASVIPVTITGHTMAPVMMLAEKGADLIKKQWIEGYL